MSNDFVSQKVFRQKEQEKRILVLSKYARNGASSRLRVFQYLPLLEQRGFSFQLSSFFDKKYVDDLYAGRKTGLLRYLSYYWKRLSILSSIATGRKKFDIMWVEKEAFPYLPALFERLIRASGIPYILDYDDAIFHNYDSHRLSVVRWLLGQKLDKLLQNSAAVMAGNKYLTDYAKLHNAPSVHFIPTVVDTTRYNASSKKPTDPVRIGWIGTPYTVRYLKSLLPTLGAASRKVNLKLVTIGAPPLDVPKGLEIEQHDWLEETENRLLASIDIGIMPLPDEPFERGKCGYKLIQYMASGCAVIGSPVGVNSQIVTSDVGYLADTDDEWMHAIVALASDSGKRYVMGEKGRQRIVEHYSLSSNVVKIEKILNEAIGGARGA